jgi:hypothetical protein
MIQKRYIPQLGSGQYSLYCIDFLVIFVLVCICFLSFMLLTKLIFKFNVSAFFKSSKFKYFNSNYSTCSNSCQKRKKGLVFIEEVILLIVFTLKVIHFLVNITAE